MVAEQEKGKVRVITAPYSSRAVDRLQLIGVALAIGIPTFFGTIYALEHTSLGDMVRALGDIDLTPDSPDAPTKTIGSGIVGKGAGAVVTGTQLPFTMQADILNVPHGMEADLVEQAEVEATPDPKTEVLPVSRSIPDSIRADAALLGNPPVEDLMRYYTEANMREAGMTEEKIAAWGRVHEYLEKNQIKLGISEHRPAVRIGEFFSQLKSA